ncbi:MAG: hypothetical protein ACI4IW_07890 [Oscillospiraceae bacterium]
MKIYAKQVPPEYQESPAFLFGIEECFPGVIFDGNDHYTSHTTPEYEQIMQYLNAMAGAWEDANIYYIYDSDAHDYTKHYKSKPDYTIGEILHEYGFYRNDGKPWNNKQKHQWRVIMENDDLSDDEAICAALELMTGKKHDCTTIRGCCQGEWQDIIFPADEYSDNAIEILETEYFNTGSEWIIHDESSDPETPEEISGYSVYCYGWNADKIRAELADAAGVDPGDVILYEYAGSYTMPKYELAGA